MNRKSMQRLARYLGIGAAVTVPALVFGQSIGQRITQLNSINLAAGNVLRSADVIVLRDALVTALQELSELQSEVSDLRQRTLSKANIVTGEGGFSGPLAPGAEGTATSDCPGTNDILINCACGGAASAGGNGNPFTDLRIVLPSNPLNAASRCTCRGANVGTGATQVVVAIATCLRP